MFYPENNLPCALCKEIGFHAVDDNRSAGFLECAAARIAVQFELEPQPHLTFYFPPTSMRGARSSQPAWTRVTSVGSISSSAPSAAR